MDETDFESLGDVILRVAASADSRALLPPAAAAAVANAVRILPADLSLMFGFECLLSIERDGVDFFMRISPDQGGAAFLAGECAVDLPPSVLEHDGWRRVRSFAREWAREGSRLNRDVRHIWFEYDASSSSGTGQLPAIFFWHPSFGLGPDEADVRSLAERHLRLTDRTGLILTGEPLPRAVRRTLTRVLRNLDPEMAVYCVGLFLGRDDRGVRLCVKRASSASILRCLDRLGWTGNRARLKDLLDLVDAFADRLQIQLEVQDDLTPRMHLELRCDEEVQAGAAGRWARLLERLVAENLALRHRAQAFMGWWGWPLEEIHGGVAHNVFARVLGHVKIVLERDGTTATKGYFGAWQVLRARHSRLLAAPPNEAV